MARVSVVKLVSAAERAREVGRELTEMKAAYYYRFQLAEIQPARARDVSIIVNRRPGRPIACALTHFAACPQLS